MSDVDPNYIINITTEELIIPSGIRYRYIKDVDPNKDLICDTANCDGLYNIKTTTKNTTSKEEIANTNNAKKESKVEQKDF